jgi:hypothetical protein
MSELMEAVVDNGAARFHVRHSSLNEIKHRVDIHLERHPPLIVADVADIERRLMRGVVDENVEASEFIDGALDDALQ